MDAERYFGEETSAEMNHTARGSDASYCSVDTADGHHMIHHSANGYSGWVAICSLCKWIDGTLIQQELNRWRAAQWFKNGDHPADLVGQPAIDHAGNRYIRIEGAVVRFFRNPRRPGDGIHAVCGRTWHDHGWLDAPDEVVCPGDWVIPDSDFIYHAHKLLPLNAPEGQTAVLLTLADDERARIAHWCRTWDPDPAQGPASKGRWRAIADELHPHPYDREPPK